MLWKLFGSELRVQEALEKSIGYDISPNVIINVPVNSDIPTGAKTRFEPSRRTGNDFSKLPQE